MTTPPRATPARRRELSIEIIRRLQTAGHTALWAGGCVRDMLIERTPVDYDIATDATPDQIAGLFERTLEIGKSFGIMTVLLDHEPFEIATFREDMEYRDGRRPEAIRFSTPERDAQRRDFTINAMFFDPLAQRLYDYAGGQEDLKRRCIRFVGQPDRRIQEDHLRMLRAVRFSCVLGFELEAETRSALRRHAALISGVSAERIRDELTRTLQESPRPGDAVLLLDALGLLTVVIPEMTTMKGVAQPPEFHPEGDVFTHTILALNHLDKPSLVTAMAVLLHDVGKPSTQSVEDGRIRFTNHAPVGAEKAAAILRRLKFSNEETDAIVACVAGHMRFSEVKSMRRATLRRLIGSPTFADELELHRVDCLACHGLLDKYEFVRQAKQAFDSEPVLPTPWVNGLDLRSMGVPEGRRIGELKRQAYDAQLEGSFIDRESLLAWIQAQIH